MKQKKCILETSDRFNLPNWHYDMEFDDIIVNNGREDDNFVDKYGNQTTNIWYNENDPHKGVHIYMMKKM